MAKEVKVLVACGSGVATSTVAQESIKDICKQAGIPIKVTKGTINEIPSKAPIVDVVMVTTNYRGTIDKPLIKVFGLISGIGKDKIKQEIIDTCKAISES